MLGAMRIFGKIPGHKSRAKDPFLRERSPAGINLETEPSGSQTTISTDRSAIRNGQENATAGVGVWHAHGSERNISLKYVNHGTSVASNSRAELGATLEALRQNEKDDLEIESDSLASPKGDMFSRRKVRRLELVRHSKRGPPQGYPNQATNETGSNGLTWVTGHDDNCGNNRADALENEERESSNLRG